MPLKFVWNTYKKILFNISLNKTFCSQENNRTYRGLEGSGGHDDR